ncbi:hypothetical protein DYB34_005185, partial [Aphanomyces astaci]
EKTLAMQSTASLQHSGESHAALEQIHYYLDGIDEGQGLSRSINALKLAEVCASKSPAAAQPPITTTESTNGRLLLRAKGGLAHCMQLVESLKLDHTANSYEHIYCMMTLLYFVTLDTENCEALTSKAFSKLLQVLQLASGTSWTLSHATADIVTPDGDAPKKRALLRKKSSSRRLGDGGTTSGGSLVPQAEALLRTDDMFRSIKFMPVVTLTDVVLSVLNNAFHTDQTTQYGISNSKSNNSTPGPTPANAALLRSRKLLLRDSGGLDIVARVIDTSFSAADPHLPGASAHLLHGLRLLDQASFLERGTQDHLVLHTNVVTVLLRILSSSSSESTVVPNELPLMALRVLINLTHKNDIACTHVAAAHGTRVLVALFLHAASAISGEDATTLPDDIDVATTSDKSTFDMCLLTLSALVNCVEHNDTNRDDVARYDDSTLDKLTLYFVGRVASFEHILHHPDTESGATWNPEDVILSGSTAMLLGCVMRGRPIYAARILAALPDQSPKLLLRVLVAFVGLHAQIGALSEEILESCVEVETELKALLKDEEGGATSIHTSVVPTHGIVTMSQIAAVPGIPRMKAKMDESLTAQLSINTPEIEFTTPKYPTTYRGNDTPPASAFQLFVGGFATARSSSPGAASGGRRKRTSRALGVDTPVESSNRVKKPTWADESEDAAVPFPTFVSQRKSLQRPSSATSTVNAKSSSTTTTKPSTDAATDAPESSPTRTNSKVGGAAAKGIVSHQNMDKSQRVRLDVIEAAVDTRRHAPTFSRRHSKRQPPPSTIIIPPIPDKEADANGATSSTQDNLVVTRQHLRKRPSPSDSTPTPRSHMSLQPATPKRRKPTPVAVRTSCQAPVATSGDHHKSALSKKVLPSLPTHKAKNHLDDVFSFDA